MTVRAIDAILARPWAITPDGLALIESIALREHEYAGNVEALEAKLGRPLANTERMTVRDGVALLRVSGPTFAKANMFARISGATSYDILATDFTVALNDPSVTAIVGVFDTPGGEVTGASELSTMFKAARGTKPMVAFVEGSMASAGYWLGSAFDRIVAADTAVIGSIGAQIGMKIPDAKAGEKSFRFVSSVSPNKNVEPGSKAGDEQYQRMADDLGSVFVDAVAANRGIKRDDVLDNYGQGAVFVAADAMARGMIDSIGTLEAVISDLSKPKGKKMEFTTLTAEQLAANRPDLVAAIGDQAVAKAGASFDAAAVRAEGAAAERQRIADVRAAALPGHEALIEQLAFDGKTTGAEAALKVLAAERAVRDGAASARQADAVEPVPTDVSASTEQDKPQAVVPSATDIYARMNAGGKL